VNADSHEALYLGLISGTSADGIDAAIVGFGDEPARVRLLHGETIAWDPDLRARLVQLGQMQQTLTLDEIGELDTRVGQAFAAAALQAINTSGLRPDQIRAIGSHGQTLRHRPHGEFPFTLQLGDANCIAERTGCVTVADFRRRDVAAGGHGAPLMPAFHAAMLRDARTARLGRTVKSRPLHGRAYAHSETGACGMFPQAQCLPP
jgi:anhydro-N-acetylmuramic acid kinase